MEARSVEWKSEVGKKHVGTMTAQTQQSDLRHWFQPFPSQFMVALSFQLLTSQTFESSLTPFF